jgi:hypothetical protein
MTRDIDNMQDLLDVRDLIARVEELEEEREELIEAVGEATDKEMARQAIRDWEALWLNELETLASLMDDMKGYGGDEQWRGDWYPLTMIRDSYFKNYAMELAEDIGAIPADTAWPCTCIDWDKAARELRTDYTSVEYDGISYWVR